ncbi:DUF4177 domain-containing protein [Miniphocaeibacter massiliensis]|uniref:DUF4177 domain-containing protein n=1 Tax=Miniphocaeibacter massiliensis TaxID=2041841 RepID=UPI000C1C7CDE|nr:DUF4177 domain-containing protein [Miniphocaeibacter massiliensis]
MKKYEYKFIRVERDKGFNIKPGDTFEKCKDIIIKEGENGWKLNQVVEVFNEKSGVNSYLGYEIIFERES